MSEKENILDLIEKDLNESSPSKEQILVYCRLLWLIGNDGIQTKQVEPDESEKMKTLRAIGHTIREVAFIFQRSTKTVHEHVKEIPASDISQFLEQRGDQSG